MISTYVSHLVGEWPEGLEMLLASPPHASASKSTGRHLGTLTVNFKTEEALMSLLGNACNVSEGEMLFRPHIEGSKQPGYLNPEGKPFTIAIRWRPNAPRETAAWTMRMLARKEIDALLGDGDDMLKLYGVSVARVVTTLLFFNRSCWARAADKLAPTFDDDRMWAPQSGRQSWRQCDEHCMSCTKGHPASDCIHRNAKSSPRFSMVINSTRAGDPYPVIPPAAMQTLIDGMPPGVSAHRNSIVTNARPSNVAVLVSQPGALAKPGAVERMMGTVTLFTAKIGNEFPVGNAPSVHFKVMTNELCDDHRCFHCGGSYQCSTKRHRDHQSRIQKKKALLKPCPEVHTDQGCTNPACEFCHGFCLAPVPGDKEPTIRADPNFWLLKSTTAAHAPKVKPPAQPSKPKQQRGPKQPRGSSAARTNHKTSVSISGQEWAAVSPSELKDAQVSKSTGGVLFAELPQATARGSRARRKKLAASKEHTLIGDSATMPNPYHPLGAPVPWLTAIFGGPSSLTFLPCNAPKRATSPILQALGMLTERE